VLARAGIARTETAHVLLMEDRSSDIRLPFHSRDDVLQMMCKGQRYVAGQGVVLGRIQDQSGAPMASARIELWRRIVNKNVELFREEIAGEAGDDGRFVVCGTPRDQVLRVRASVNDASAETLTDSRADGLGVVVLTVHRKP
jgi:hypothetical protein